MYENIRVPSPWGYSSDIVGLKHRASLSNRGRMCLSIGGQICLTKKRKSKVWPEFDSASVPLHCMVRGAKYNTVDSEIFARILFFDNCIKRLISDVKNSLLRQDLPTSINDRVILPFREGFIFTKLRSYAKFRENKVLAKISEFTVCFWFFFS